MKTQLLSTYFYKIDEIGIVFGIQRVANCITPVSRTSRQTTLLRTNQLLHVIEKHFTLLALLDHFCGRHADSNPEELQQFILVDGREEGSSSDQLGENAAERPNVDGLVVGQTENDLRAAIKAALDVFKATFEFSASGAKVDNFDLRARAIRK